MIKELVCDILVIGCGPAGLAAAIYTARAGKKTIVISGRNKSRLNSDYKIFNYPGFKNITGSELLNLMKEQALGFGVEIIEEDVLELTLDMNPKMVATRDSIISATAVIIAMGKGGAGKRIDGEENFLGLGVAYCAVCDGPLFKGKTVAVYGNDSIAVEDAMMLKDIGAAVYLFTYCDGDECHPVEWEMAAEKGIEVLLNTEIFEVGGETTVRYIKYRNSEGIGELPVDALFIVKEIPATSLLHKSGLHLTPNECVDVNLFCETSIEGVFAAGDVTCGGMQIAIAVGDGAKAALSSLKYLRAKS